MPSTRKIVSFRPDSEEEKLLEKIAKKRAISASRAIAQLIREEAERTGITVEVERQSGDVATS